ncbi:MAG: tetratricopeptide repeat protein, partial [Methanoregula sp.]|nr:tetratricopeptide repeat protein [Methanoregula sp.]
RLTCTMPDDSVTAFEEGKSLFDHRHYDDAIAKFRQAIVRDPGSCAAHHYLGRSLLEKKLQDEAVGEFCEAIRTNPSDGNSRYWLATVLLSKGSTADAVSLLYEAIRLEPGLLHHFSDQVVTRLQKQCPFRETEEFLKNSIAILEALPRPRASAGDINRSRAHLHGGLGRLYFSKGLLNGAMLQYREAVRISPEEPLFHGDLADIYFITNNGKEAVTEYRAALARDADNAEVRKKLGDALVKTRQFIEAFNEYREAARLEPGNEYYKRVYSQFRTLFIDRSQEGAPVPAHERQQAPPGGIPSVADEMFASLIRGGENEFVEFKSSALWSKSFSKGEIAASDSKDIHKFGKDTSKVVIAKTIAGFLNTEGGNLIIGIRENKGGAPDEIIGIENEFSKLKDPCPDGYRRMLVDEIIKRFFPSEIFHHLSNYIRIHFMKQKEGTLCWLEIKKAGDGVFLTVQGEEYFFIRIDAETRQIADKALVDYCRKHFT